VCVTTMACLGLKLKVTNQVQDVVGLTSILSRGQFFSFVIFICNKILYKDVEKN